MFSKCRNTTFPTLLLQISQAGEDTGFGANVPVKAAYATKGVVIGSATDANGRVSVTLPPQSGVVVVPA